MVAFHGEGDAKLDFVEVDLLIIVEDVLVEDLADSRVVTVKELDQFHWRVYKNDDDDAERYNAARHGMDCRLTL